MRICHFWAQNGPFVLNKIFLVQAIIITFIYLSALFIVQNLKKSQRIQSYEDAQFLSPNGPFPRMRIFPENLLMSLVSLIHVYLHAKNQSQISIY